MLQADAVTVVRRGRKLLDRVSVDVEAGKLTIVIGPNGAGKSTLLKVLSREIIPDTGRVRLDEDDIARLSAHELSLRRAVVPQATSLSFPFTVFEVAMLGATVPGFGLDDRRAREAAAEALHRVDLEGFERRLYTELSGGERQRVHLARALCQLELAPRRPGQTTVLLLDEPTTGLDLAHQVIVIEEMRYQARQGRAVLAILHDLNLAATHADVLVLLHRGRVAAAGPVQHVFKDMLLSEAFDCRIRTNAVPDPGVPYLLPQLVTVEQLGISS